MPSFQLLHPHVQLLLHKLIALFRFCRQIPLHVPAITFTLLCAQPLVNSSRPAFHAVHRLLQLAHFSLPLFPFQEAPLLPQRPLQTLRCPVHPECQLSPPTSNLSARDFSTVQLRICAMQLLSPASLTSVRLVLSRLIRSCASCKSTLASASPRQQMPSVTLLASTSSSATRVAPREPLPPRQQLSHPPCAPRHRTCQPRPRRICSMYVRASSIAHQRMCAALCRSRAR